MAQGKKSFQMYTEWIEVFNELDNEDAGQLIKHIFKYVNDENPIAENKLVTLSFIQIKQQLKRDLKKWKTKSETNKANGSLGGRPRNPTEPKITERLILKPKKPVEVEVEVEDKVKEENNNIDVRKLTFKNSLWNKFKDDYKVKTLEAFYLYWTEHGDTDKKMRFEKEKSFNTNLRLKRWSKNNFDNSEPKEQVTNNAHMFQS